MTVIWWGGEANRCRYCEELGKDLVPSLRGGFRCKTFYRCLSQRSARVSEYLDYDADVSGPEKCWLYFVDRLKLPKRGGKRGRSAVSTGYTYPFRSMAGAPDMPGNLGALDDMAYRRELAVSRMEQTVQTS